MTNTTPSLEWEKIIEDFYEPIYRFALHMVGKKDEALDIVQETFYKALKGKDSLSNNESVRAWLYQIARNLIIDRGRWWKRWGFSSAALPEQHYDAPMEQQIIVKEVLHAILKLPVRQREVFTLRNLHGFSTSETAHLLQMSEGTVKSHLHRAIGALGAVYKERTP